MLTARSAESDMLHGFVVGADDYVKKPFSQVELEVRIRALLKRSQKQQGVSGIIQYSDKLLSINLETQVVMLDGKVLELSATEFNLLACLVRNMGKTMTHSQLLHEVWGYDSGNLSSKLTLYICYLRKKLKGSDQQYDYIHTQWGRGYSFVPVNMA
jgi:DNA-binding response OmpR family regulator